MSSRRLHRILLAAGASLILYVAAFACILDRPLTLGSLQKRIDANLRYGAILPSPKLVILAGSNGPYSHRCEIIGPIVHRPCVNAGVAVGIGLDYLFTRWKPLLHPGDILYMPMEEAQYVRPRAATELGPDTTIMLRHDRATLLTMPLRRQVAALFAANLRGAVMSLIEMALVAEDFQDPREAALGAYNQAGDHIGHTARLGAANQSSLAEIIPVHPTSVEIQDGYGSTQVRTFVQWAFKHDVRVVGGLPTGFDDSPIPEGTIAAISALYQNAGASFLDLPNHSRYPRSAFFDTADHLNEAAQIRHSITVALALKSGFMGLTRERSP